MIYVNKKPEFFSALRAEVNNYFIKNKIKKSGNWKLYTKASFLLILFGFLFSIPYIHELPLWLHWLLSGIALATVTSAIGFNIGHDSAHGSFSSNGFINNLFSYSFDLVGVSNYFWRPKHNIAHHTYTNVEGLDDDTSSSGIFRFSNEQRWYPWHRVQAFYALLFYSLLYFQWIYFKDFQKWAQKKVGNVDIKKMNGVQVTSIIASKILHLILFWIIPIIYFGFWKTLIVTGSLYLFCGIIITIVFQLAHIQTKSHFPVPSTITGNIENDWAIEQINTTANFATWNPLVTQFTGGLNHQVEHHLFPNISHVHYPAIRKIVKKNCEKFGIQYNEYSTTIGAIIDHMKYLWIMGKKPKNV